MSTIGGAFTETQLLDIRVKAEMMGFDDRIKQQFNPNLAVIDLVKAAQTANVIVGKAQKKDVDVEVIWDNYCDYTAEDNTTCVIGGTESSTNAETYSITNEKVVNFSFNEASFIDNEFDVPESVVKGFKKADMELAENFAALAVARIDSFAGVNQFTGGKGNVVGTETYIDSAYWDSSLVAYFQRVGILNKFTSPLFLSGSNLYEAMLVARARAGNADGKGDQNLFSGLNMYFDLFNVDTVNSPDLKTYMLSLGSIAWGMKFTNPIIPERTQPFTRWAVESTFIPGLWYDVFYTTECTTGDLIQHNFKMKARNDIWNNPTGCTETNTGVLSFTCGTAP